MQDIKKVEEIENRRYMGILHTICSVFGKKTILKIEVLIFKTKTKWPGRFEKEQSRIYKNKNVNIEISRLDLGKENWVSQLKKYATAAQRKKEMNGNNVNVLQ